MIPSLGRLVLVVYAYHETPESRSNVEYFLSHGLPPSSAGDVVFVVNGAHTVIFPPSVRVIERANDCFDFGAWGAGLAVLEDLKIGHDFFVLLNASVRGPFLPLYVKDPWWKIFRPSAPRALFGTTVNCMEFPQYNGPINVSETTLHLQSMALAVDNETMIDLLRPFLQECAPTKDDAIYNLEMPLSRAAVAAGRPLETLSLAFDYEPKRGFISDESSYENLKQTCRKLREISAFELGDVYYPKLSVLGHDVHPLEVVFFKANDRSAANRHSLDRMTDWRYFHYYYDETSKAPEDPLNCDATEIYDEYDYSKGRTYKASAHRLKKPRGIGCDQHFQDFLQQTAEPTPQGDPSSCDQGSQDHMRELANEVQELKHELEGLKETLDVYEELCIHSCPCAMDDPDDSKAKHRRKKPPYWDKEDNDDDDVD